MRDVCRIKQLLSENGVNASTIQDIVDELNVLPSLKVASSNVRIIDNTAVTLVVLRGRLNGKKIQRTIYHGYNILTQLMQRWSIPSSIATEIRLLIKEELDELEKKVREESLRLTSNKEIVERVKNDFRKRSDKAIQVKRANLVATLVDLLSQGWTRESLISCLDEATCKVVLDS